MAPPSYRTLAERIQWRGVRSHGIARPEVAVSPECIYAVQATPLKGGANIVVEFYPPDLPSTLKWYEERGSHVVCRMCAKNDSANAYAKSVCRAIEAEAFR